MPKPPPPPPGPPPPPAFPTGIANLPASSKKNGGGPDKRNQLLADIRGGARLKKAVTNDRSAPAIEGKPKSNAAPVSNGGPPGLAGLFAGGMPQLKPAGFNQRQPALIPPNKKAPDSTSPNHSSIRRPDVNSQSFPSSPQPTSKTGIPAGYGTMRGFPKDLKGLAPQPPPASHKPHSPNSIGAADNARNRPGPPLPNKPPNVPNVRLNFAPAVPRAPPSSKPPPPPKSPAVLNGPPALPSKPPNRPRPQSVNESDYRLNGRPIVRKNSNQASPVKERPPSIPNPELQSNRMKNASTPNLHQLPMSKPQPPPPPPRADQAFQQFNSLPFKLNGPPQQRPSHVKAPATRPPPPPPAGPPRSVHASQPSVPPPPPPHRATLPPAPQSSLHAKPSFNHLPNNAPPPPPRNSSTRNSTGDEFDSRFYHMFISVNQLPTPDPFTNCSKTYPSKMNQGTMKREQAPPVPSDHGRGKHPGTDTYLQIAPKMFADPASEC